MLVFPQAAGHCGLSFAAASGGFVVGGAWAQLYRLAYQQAQAALAPSRFQKACEPRWN